MKIITVIIIIFIIAYFFIIIITLVLIYLCSFSDAHLLFLEYAVARVSGFPLNIVENKLVKGLSEPGFF